MDTRNDRAVVLTVVVALALVVLIVISAEVYLVSVGRQLPDSIVVMGSGALGAIAGLLASTSTKPVQSAPPPAPVVAAPPAEGIDLEQPAAA